MKPAFTTYHYGDNGVRDHGWGCSYRNAQTLASALHVKPIPTLKQMLSVYGLAFPKGGRDKRHLWIEPPQVRTILWKLCGVRSDAVLYTREDPKQFESTKMLRSKLSDFVEHFNDASSLLQRLDQHFADSGGLPVIVDDAIYSYMLVPHRAKDKYTLIDPHVGRGKRGSIRVLSKTDFVAKSGWMMLFPHFGPPKILAS